jgi:hypothetical protein
MASPAETGKIHRDCPSCGAASANMPLVSYSDPDWPMKRCPECDLVFLEWVPEYGALYNALAWTKQREKEEQRRLKT